MLMERDQHGIEDAKISHEKRLNRLRVARYRQRHGDAHRQWAAAYMRAYRARLKLLRQNNPGEENPHDHQDR